MKQHTFGIPLISSCLLHFALLLMLSLAWRQTHLLRHDPVRVELLDVARTAPGEKLQEQAKPPQPKKIEPVQPPFRNETAKVQPQPISPTKEEAPKVAETKTAATTKVEGVASTSAPAHAEGGGSEAGTGNAFGKADHGVAPGTGSGGGGGMAIAGLGRGAGVPGLPAPFAPLRTNREARPIQTARAVYPVMALRAGMEADVTLKIEIDPMGNVTKAEIIKSGGGGFDEEALKAVKLSRFEPAQRDGHNVPAEFTYVYKFRLQR